MATVAVEYPYTCLDRQLRDMIERDDNDNFVDMISSATATKLNEAEMLECLERMICHTAVKCAVSLLDDTNCGQDVELIINRPLPFSQIPPLHLAAANGCVDLVKLFLQHNAQSDMRCQCDGETYHDMLPLNIGLEAIRASKYVVDWSPEQSIFKILINLCLPELRSRLEVVKLLASSCKGLEKEIFLCMKEGKIVEFTVLLIVAREKIMSPSLFHRLLLSFPSQNDSSLSGSVTLRNYVLTELTLLAALEAKQMFRNQSDVACLCKERQALKMPILLLLQVFERAGDDIQKYLQVQQTCVHKELAGEGVAGKTDGLSKQIVKEVACLLDKAGFSVQYNDSDLSHAERCLPGEIDWRDIALHGFFANKSEALQMDLTISEGMMNLDGFHPGEQKKKNRLQNRPVNHNNQQRRTKRMASAQLLDEYLKFVLQSSIMLHDSTTIFGSDDGLKIHSMYPLCQVLESLCDHQLIKDWSPEKSIFKLVYILCSPELRKSVDEIESLVHKTEEIGVIACNYVKEGKLVEFATLLLVAPLRLGLVPFQRKNSIFGVGESMMIHECIMSEFREVIDRKTRLIGKRKASESGQQWKEKQLFFALQLVEVFEKAGFDIYNYCKTERYKGITKEEVANDLAFLLEFIGFDLKPSDRDFDDMNYYSFRLGEKQSEELNGLLQQPVSIKFCSQGKLPVTGATVTHKFSRATCQYNFPSFFSAHLSFLTYPNSRAGSYLRPSWFRGTRTIQSTKNFLSSLSPFSSHQKWASFLSATRRGLKTI